MIVVGVHTQIAPLESQPIHNSIPEFCVIELFTIDQPMSMKITPQTLDLEIKLTHIEDS